MRSFNTTFAELLEISVLPLKSCQCNRSSSNALTPTHFLVERPYCALPDHTASQISVRPTTTDEGYSTTCMTPSKLAGRKRSHITCNAAKNDRIRNPNYKKEISSCCQTSYPMATLPDHQDTSRCYRPCASRHDKDGNYKPHSTNS